MTPKQKANDLVDTFRMILMNEDTDCGNEVLCSLIAIKHAQLVCDEILSVFDLYKVKKIGFYKEVKQELKVM